jgi:hypothetical protein
VFRPHAEEFDLPDEQAETRAPSLALLAILVAVEAPAPAAGPAPNPPLKPMLICRAPERMVGSRIRRGATCKTAEEWALEDARRDRKPADMRVTEGQQINTGAPSSPR